MSGITGFIHIAKQNGLDLAEDWSIHTTDGKEHRGTVVEVLPDAVVIQVKRGDIAERRRVLVCIPDRAIVYATRSAEDKPALTDQT